MIIKAAILRGRVIFKGESHCKIINNNKGINFKGCIQGFVTDTGKFFNRRDAAKHAYLCGQIKVRKELLFSEDLNEKTNSKEK